MSAIEVSSGSEDSRVSSPMTPDEGEEVTAAPQRVLYPFPVPARYLDPKYAFELLEGYPLGVICPIYGIDIDQRYFDMTVGIMSPEGKTALLNAICEAFKPGQDIDTVCAADLVDYMSSLLPSIQASVGHGAEAPSGDGGALAVPPSVDSGAADAAGGAVVMDTVKSTIGKFSEAMTTAAEAAKLDTDYATPLHKDCAALKKKNMRVGPNVGLFSVGGYGDTPRVADIVCMGCKTTMSDFYMKHGSERAHCFCFKQQGHDYEKTCVGISKCHLSSILPMPPPQLLNRAPPLPPPPACHPPTPSPPRAAVSKELHTFIANNFDVLIEQSKELNKKSARA
jgi:hypothetical protein